MIKNLPLSAYLLPLAFAFIMLTFIFPKMVAVQLGIVVSFASIYMSVSLLQHRKDKSLTPQVMLEYILVATLVLVLVAGVSI